MVEIRLELNDQGKGAFRLYEGEKAFGELAVEITGDRMIAQHTEIDPKSQGKGYGKMLFEAMAEHARQHNLKVKAYCPYIHAQFKRHKEEYADILEETE